LKIILNEAHVRIKDLKPGMETVNLRIKILQLQSPRKVITKLGRSHVLVDGLAEDLTGRAPITFWNDQIEALSGVRVGDIIEVKNGFVSSFKGERRVNVGRGSEVRRVEEAW